MGISSAIVGTRLYPHKVALTARQCMNYAAAVGDPNPAYMDDTRPEGIIAPPMMAVSLTWQITQRFPDFMDQGNFPRDQLGYGVHYVEGIDWHRPMTPGDRLTILGRIVAVFPHRSGTYVGLQYDAEDQAGDPVFSEHFGWVYRGVGCDGAGQGNEAAPVFPPIESGPGPLWEEEVPIGPLFAHVYDGCADIFNPIHTSRRFARSVGLPDPILHGTATLALAVKALVDRESGGDPRRLRGLRCRFTAMVLLNSAVRVQLLSRRDGPSGVELSFQVLTDAGGKAISQGRAVVSLA